MSSDHPRAERPGSDEPGLTVGRVIGTVLAGVWLIYLVQPISQAWAERSEPHRVVGLAALVTFAGIYLWHFLDRRDVRADTMALTDEERDRLHRRPLHLARYAGLVLCSAIAPWALGQTGSATWVFLAVAGLFTFSIRVAGGIGAALTIALFVVPRVASGWQRDDATAMSTALAMVAVGAGVLAGRRQRQVVQMREENTRLQLEEERGRLSRDLHDILGHSLTVITVKADLANRVFEADPTRAKQELVEIERLARDALVDVRHTIAGMRTLSLASELSRARNALRAAQIDADLPQATDEVDERFRELFAWAIRESVTNVVRHSRADRCWIELTPTSVRISDDGVGCASLNPGAGNGLRGLRERATAAGARLVTTSVHPHGFAVAVYAAAASDAASDAAPDSAPDSASHPVVDL